VVHRDTRAAAASPSDASDLVATAADVPPVAAPPRPMTGPGDGGDGPTGGAIRPVLLALLAVGVVALVILAVVLARGGGESPSAPTTSVSATPTPTPGPARPPAAPTGAPTTEAAPTTTTTGTSTTTTTSATTTTTTTDAATPTSAEAVAFVQSYYGLLPGNTSAAWAQLGPTAQAQSGGRGNFDRFYAGLRSVTLENARPAGGNAVAGTILFVQNNGTTTREGYRFVVGGGGGRPVIESFSRA
jgi:eukaryotic-like serine/threonine-protein kinase